MQSSRELKLIYNCMLSICYAMPHVYAVLLPEVSAASV